MAKAQPQDDPDKPSGWRGSRELWLDAAKQAIVEAGVEAVKIQPLATRLNLARTSFYWFFKDRRALLDAVLEEWEAKNTGAFVEACSAYAETITEANLNLIVVFHDETLFEPRLDFAIRGWAHHAPAVAERINATDETRLDAIRAMFERFGFEAGEADVRARAVYLTQIGYISMKEDGPSEPLEPRLGRMPHYAEIFTGKPVSNAEIARFRARHPIGY